MSDIKFEIERQLVHMTGGIAIGLGVWHLMPTYNRLTAVPIFLGIIFFKLLPKIKMFGLHHHLLHKYERKEDLKKTPYKGAINYGIGIIPAIVFLDIHHAVAIIMILSVGDSLSTIVGKTIGRIPVGPESFDEAITVLRERGIRSSRIEDFLLKVKRSSTGYKTLEGFMGFLVGGVLAATLFVGVTAGFFLGMLGAFIELLVPLDDNISIPWILTIVAGIFLH